MKRITLQAPCKINLSLDITARRPDGYHAMDMVMQTVGLYDRLTIEKTEETGLIMTCNIPGLSCDESNIVLRCAKVFFDHTGIQPSATFHLEKHIPMMAGLGGGSADGAAVLVGLNQLYDTRLSQETLCQLGFTCGADIPFCIRGGTLRAQGAGEIFSPASAMPKDCFVLVVKPLFSVSTKLAFQGFDEQESPMRAHPEQTLAALESGSLEQLGKTLENVFEPFCRPEEIGAIKETMVSCGASGALMSGSGSAVFGLFRSREQAEACAAQLKSQAEQVDVAVPVDYGPTIVEQEE